MPTSAVAATTAPGVLDTLIPDVSTLLWPFYLVLCMLGHQLDRIQHHCGRCTSRSRGNEKLTPRR